jgi:hypothetical protein
MALLLLLMLQILPLLSARTMWIEICLAASRRLARLFGSLHRTLRGAYFGWGHAIIVQDHGFFLGNVLTEEDGKFVRL